MQPEDHTMFADLLLTIGKVVAVIIIATIFIYSLIPGQKFFKKHGRSYLESDKPHKPQE